ncbi:MAG: GNAT family N-acetyltransferase [Ardenticatenaceae bacterium]|nr:GNAT family N-acetyltransferase [Ardenticatenaceae bacterium]
MTLKVVPASQFSLDELTEAYNQTRMDYIVPMPMTAARLREYIEAYDIDLDHSCAVLDSEEPDLIYGIGMLGVRDDRTWITRMGVLPYARRLGTGSKIMSWLIEHTRMIGVSQLWLEVIQGNEPAKRLFEKCGFKLTRELIVSRRPPGQKMAKEPTLAIVDVKPLKFEAMLNYLAHRKDRPNWLNETETFYNLKKLSGFLMKLNDGSEGWVIYEPSAMQLKRVLVEVLSGEEARVTEAILYWVHQKLPILDAVSENIPIYDQRWIGYEAAGYFDSFHRLEMVKDMRHG